MHVKIEVKLFMLTKHLYALYQNDSEVMKHLHRILGGTEAFWEAFLIRFQELKHSRETQCMLLRQAGYSYRQISSVLKISNATIQRILNEYELEYGEIEGITDILSPLAALEQRLEQEGMSLWEK